MTGSGTPSLQLPLGLCLPVDPLPLGLLRHSARRSTALGLQGQPGQASKHARAKVKACPRSCYGSNLFNHPSIVAAAAGGAAAGGGEEEPEEEAGGGGQLAAAAGGGACSHGREEAEEEAGGGGQLAAAAGGGVGSHGQEEAEDEAGGGGQLAAAAEEEELAGSAAAGGGACRGSGRLALRRRRGRRLTLCFDACKNRCSSTPARIAVLRRQQGAGSATAAEGRLGSITFDDIPEYAVDSYNDLCVARAMEKRGQFPGEFADRAYLSRADRALTPVPSEYVRPGVRRRQAKARLDTLRGMMHEGDGRYRGSQGRKGGGSYHRVSPPATI